LKRQHGQNLVELNQHTWEYLRDELLINCGFLFAG
jgi:hypothetical protein